MDSYFRDKKEVIQPDLVGDLVININFFLNWFKNNYYGKGQRI